MSDWWQAFFDADYVRLWGQGGDVAAQTAAQVEGLWSLLGLRAGSRVLDAPCGYGRLSRPLAERGALVLGVDQAQALVEQAERERGSLSAAQLRYLRHDLRRPLAETGFDSAFNVFTSLGYGTEDDDLAVEQPRFDAIAGRMETCWYWSGPSGHGKKPASLRVYTATELVRLIERAGLRFRSAHRGCTPEPFRAEGPDLGGRLGLLAARAA
jgi:SAM-dependent methyltransferase